MSNNRMTKEECDIAVTAYSDSGKAAERLKRANELAKSMRLDRTPKCWSCAHCGEDRSPLYPEYNFCKLRNGMCAGGEGCDSYDGDNAKAGCE